ncbi:TonB-dependent receptor [Sphingomonas profundi]|uniref:TonB-dependent receptor n=1 Tax=Alterirhizorhabdus profundi TaxID=2681549 RepID=UPI001E51FC5C|nr:TonB-dependent receptor [Sphingomonas profundi]
MTPRRSLLLALACSTSLIAAPALAQEAGQGVADVDRPADIIVTATKRSESLQKVPISIQVLGEQLLDQRQVQSSDDYAKLLPSVSFQSFGPSQSQLYFRGVTSGGDGLHGGSLPTAGVYLDETPVTTIANNVDIHIYDIARVEALSGPQGTLFGASSLAGTLRIITNKPDPSKFSAGYDLQGNKFGKGDYGGVGEAFVNIPLSEAAAIRLVGFYQHDGGYIDNTPGTRTYTLGDLDDTTNLTVNNNALVKKDFNDVDTYGGRAALKVDLDEDWTVTPSVVYQHQKTRGAFLFDPKVGDLQVHDFTPSENLDRWFQSALTIEGKLGDWNVLYSGGYFERKVDNRTDYSYYTVAYDTPGYYYTNFPTGTGGFLDPTQTQILRDKYTKQTHELRVTSPADNRLRLVAGLFFQRQTDAIAADYIVPGISGIPTPPVTVPIPGFGDSVFRTRLHRSDNDYAAFAEAAFDIVPDVTLNAGIRGFIAHNELAGFSGFAFNVDPAVCLPTAATNRPCDNVDKANDESGETHKVNLTWRVTPDQMVYATYSTGFRPGGNNRRPGILPYKSDTLNNYEIGFKTSLFDRRLRFNGAIFHETWKNLQYGLSPVGSLGVTNIYNAGNARINGAEGDFALSLGGFVLSGSGTYIDAKLTTDFCQFDAAGNSICTPGVAPAASRGTRLPIQPRFKGNLTARYNLQLGTLASFAQGTVNYQGGTRSYLTEKEATALGRTSRFATADFSIGVSRDNWTFELFVQNAFDKRGILSKNTACAPGFCAPFARLYPIKPQIFGVKAGQRF